MLALRPTDINPILFPTVCLFIISFCKNWRIQKQVNFMVICVLWCAMSIFHFFVFKNGVINTSNGFLFHKMINYSNADFSTDNIGKRESIQQERLKSVLWSFCRSHKLTSLQSSHRARVLEIAHKIGFYNNSSKSVDNSTCNEIKISFWFSQERLHLNVGDCHKLIKTSPSQRWFHWAISWG